MVEAMSFVALIPFLLLTVGLGLWFYGSTKSKPEIRLFGVILSAICLAVLVFQYATHVVKF